MRVRRVCLSHQFSLSVGSPCASPHPLKSHRPLYCLAIRLVTTFVYTVLALKGTRPHSPNNVSGREDQRGIRLSWFDSDPALVSPGSPPSPESQRVTRDDQFASVIRHIHCAKTVDCVSYSHRGPCRSVDRCFGAIRPTRRSRVAGDQKYRPAGPTHSMPQHHHQT